MKLYKCYFKKYDLLRFNGWFIYKIKYNFNFKIIMRKFVKTSKLM